MTTRCKFRCTSKVRTEAEHGVFSTIELYPVTGGSEENESFWEATPQGKLEFGTVNDSAAAEFEPGKEYYIDISLVPTE